MERGRFHYDDMCLTVFCLENGPSVQAFCPGSVQSLDKWSGHVAPEIARGTGPFVPVLKNLLFRFEASTGTKGSEAFCGLLAALLSRLVTQAGFILVRNPIVVAITRATIYRCAQEVGSLVPAAGHRN
jgi:hypothetical protein